MQNSLIVIIKLSNKVALQVCTKSYNVISQNILCPSDGQAVFPFHITFQQRPVDVKGAIYLGCTISVHDANTKAIDFVNL